MDQTVAASAEQCPRMRALVAVRVWEDSSVELPDAGIHELSLQSPWIQTLIRTMTSLMDVSLKDTMVAKLVRRADNIQSGLC